MQFPPPAASSAWAEFRAGVVAILPATIAVIDGKIRIGLDQATLEKLARGGDILKLSRADLAYGLSSGRTGALTVAATMIAAKLAGIKIFATGGIGGVHRGVDDRRTDFEVAMVGALRVDATDEAQLVAWVKQAAAIPGWGKG